MASDTKERILQKSLEMFAENGYKGTNLRELALSLGLSKSALYRHFESKEDIWNALMARVEEYYVSRFGSKNTIQVYPQSAEEFYNFVIKMISFTINDKNIILIRKILASEQFHSESACELASGHFLTGLNEMFSDIFAVMIENGVLKNDDPEILALSFTTPVSALILQSDRKPETKEESVKTIKAFVKHFTDTYFI